MFNLLRGRAVVTIAATAALATGIAAAPASAQTNQHGLVNVSVSDVTVPIGVAANVCNVSANVLAANNFSGPFGDCSSVAPVSGGGGGGGSNTNQSGLVNIAVTDVTVPIGVAANVCNVAANVLAAGNFSGPFGDCSSIAPVTA